MGSPNHYAGRAGQIPIALVIHTMAGTLDGCDSWFQNPASQVSAHYGAGLDGRLHQYVDLANGSWANGILEAGNSWHLIGPPGVNPNYCTVTVETEDRGNPNQAVTQEEYDATKSACLYGLEKYPSIRYLITHTVISPQSRPQCCGSRWISPGHFQRLADELGLEAWTH